MSKLKSVLVYIGSGFAGLVGTIFGFLELRSVYAGDYNLMNVPPASYFSYAFKGLYFLGIVALAVLIIIFEAKKKEMCFALFALSIALLIGALISLLHFEYYISLAFVFVTGILVAITTIGFFKTPRQESSSFDNNLPSSK